MLPYWRKTGIDPRYGGYRLRDYGSERWTRLHRWRARQHASKQIMSQSRLVWVFAHAELTGFTDGSGADLEAARNGYAFLVDHFWDNEHGGWRWATTREGGPRDARKSLCGQVMMVLALVEYVRATSDAGALRYLNDTFDIIDTRFRDEVFGGWTENLSRELLPIDDGLPMVDMIGFKSANVTLHVMEAFAELADLTGDPRMLRAARRVRRHHAHAVPHRRPGRMGELSPRRLVARRRPCGPRALLRSRCRARVALDPAPSRCSDVTHRGTTSS